MNRELMQKIGLFIYDSSGNNVIASNLKSYSANNELIHLTDSLDLNDFNNKVGSSCDAAIFCFKISSKSELQRVIQYLKLNFRAIQMGFLKVVCLNNLKNKKVLNILQKLGCKDFLREDIKPRQVQYKFDFWVKTFKSVILKKEIRERMNQQSNEKKEIRKTRDFKIDPPMDIKEDFWLLKHKDDLKKVIQRYFIRLVGPSPMIGSWLKDENVSNGWIWRVKDSDSPFSYIQDDGDWTYIGSKPDFDWKIKKWVFTGAQPSLYFTCHNTKDISKRIYLKDSVLHISKNSSSSKEYEPMIIDSFRSKDGSLGNSETGDDITSIVQDSSDSNLEKSLNEVSLKEDSDVLDDKSSIISKQEDDIEEMLSKESKVSEEALIHKRTKQIDEEDSYLVDKKKSRTKENKEKDNTQSEMKSSNIENKKEESRQSHSIQNTERQKRELTKKNKIDFDEKQTQSKRINNVMKEATSSKKSTEIQSSGEKNNFSVDDSKNTDDKKVSFGHDSKISSQMSGKLSSSNEKSSGHLSGTLQPKADPDNLNDKDFRDTSEPIKKGTLSGKVDKSNEKGEKDRFSFDPSQSNSKKANDLSIEKNEKNLGKELEIKLDEKSDKELEIKFDEKSGEDIELEIDLDEKSSQEFDFTDSKKDQESKEMQISLDDKKLAGIDSDFKDDTKKSILDFTEKKYKKSDENSPNLTFEDENKSKKSETQSDSIDNSDKKKRHSKETSIEDVEQRKSKKITKESRDEHGSSHKEDHKKPFSGGSVDEEKESKQYGLAQLDSLNSKKHASDDHNSERDDSNVSFMSDYAKKQNEKAQDDLSKQLNNTVKKSESDIADEIKSKEHLEIAENKIVIDITNDIGVCLESGEISLNVKNRNNDILQATFSDLYDDEIVFFVDSSHVEVDDDLSVNLKVSYHEESKNINCKGTVIEVEEENSKLMVVLKISENEKAGVKEILDIMEKRQNAIHYFFDEVKGF